MRIVGEVARYLTTTDAVATRPMRSRPVMVIVFSPDCNGTEAARKRPVVSLHGDGVIAPARPVTASEDGSMFVHVPLTSTAGVPVMNPAMGELMEIDGASLISVT